MSQTIERRIDRIRRGEVPEKYRKRATGIVPCDWAEYSLGEIYKERKLAGDPKLPILTVSIHSGVSDGTLTEDELGKKVKRIEDKTQYKTAKAGDLVFNMMRAWQGAIGVARSDGLVSPAYIVANPEHEVFPLFMDYYMKQPRMVNMIHRQSYGVTDFRLRLYWDSFAQIQVSLPSIAEQKRIVEILSTQDKIIELLEKKVEQLQLLKKSYMQKLFPRAGSSVPEIRFSGFAGPWEQRKFSDLVLIERGGSPRPIDDYITDAPDGLNWVKIGDAPEQGRYITKTAEKIKPEGLTKTRQVQPGDLILSNSMSFGKPYIMGINGCIHDGWLLIRDTQSRFDLKFLCHMLGTDQMLDQYRMFAAGSTVNNLNKELVGNTMVSLPSVEEQRAIGEYLESIDNLITLHQRKCYEEKRKKQALMQLLLTGIVRE
jgi:type I restriction enzyme S subunit